MCSIRRYMPFKNLRRFKLAVLSVVGSLILFAASNQTTSSQDPMPIKTPTTPKALQSQQMQRYHNPWCQVPEFELFLRMFHGKKEIYEQVLIQSMRVFWPSKVLKMVAVLDDESHADHMWASSLATSYPYPRVMFEKSSRYYHNSGYCRQQFTMFHADLYTTAEYVGFIDTDTIFVTPITPSMLFEDGKPVIIGQIGVDPNHGRWWKRIALNTAFWFKHNEVMRCMSYFPVIIKVRHLVELRRRVEKIHNKTFDEFYEHMTVGPAYSQFSIMCQFLWLYHRDEYKFYFHNLPNDNWTEVTPGAVPKGYYKNNTTPEQHRPKPRVAAHWGYPEPFPQRKSMRNFHWFLDTLTAGFCYSIGVKYCPKKCPAFNNNILQRRLFLFEGNDWSWHPACLQLQQKHYMEVAKLIQYYNDTHQPVLGVDSIEDACNKWPYKFEYNRLVIR